MEYTRDGLPRHLRDNPMFAFSAETNFVPAWDRIRRNHVRPAYRFALEDMARQLTTIADNPSSPTFENTVEAIYAAEELQHYFCNIAETLMPGSGRQRKDFNKLLDDLAAMRGEINDSLRPIDRKLMDRVREVIKSPEFSRLSREKKRLCHRQMREFLDIGAHLSDEDAEKVGAAVVRAGRLARQAQLNMDLAQKNLRIFSNNERELAGLPPHVVKRAKLEAKRLKRKTGKPAGRWAFTPDDVDHILDDGKSRALRRRTWKQLHSLGSRSPYDNRKTVLALLAAQYEEAAILGYRSISDLRLRDAALSTPQAAADFIERIRLAAKPAAMKELATLIDLAKADGVELKPWDVAFYRERRREEVLNYNAADVWPYFELETVLQGTLRHFEEFFGIAFRESKRYPVYNPDVRAFDIRDRRSGRLQGVLFLDLLDRPDKPVCVAQNATVFDQGLFAGKVRRPVDQVVFKFERGKPTLLYFEEVIQLLHEIGHATHSALSRCRYKNFSGQNIAPDLVEIPSKLQEDFGYDIDFLGRIAFHHKTGEPMPMALKQKLMASRNFMAATEILDMAQKSWIDLSWYRSDPATISNIRTFEQAASKDFRLLPAHNDCLIPRFDFIHGGGYESTYSSYLHSEMNEAALHEELRAPAPKGMEARQRYRCFLERSGSVSARAASRAIFNGNATSDAMMRRYMLATQVFNSAAASEPPRSPEPGIFLEQLNFTPGPDFIGEPRV